MAGSSAGERDDLADRQCAHLALDFASALEPDAYRGTALEKRLLDAWYTGLFSLDGLSDIRSFDTTLMWRVAGVDPSPGMCRGGPESWASAPSNI